MRLLAFSSSRDGNGGYLESAAPLIEQFLGSNSLTIAFFSFASVDNDFEAYATKVREGLSSLPHTIKLVTLVNAKEVIETCDAIMVGGGNTFKLLHDIYQFDLFQLIQQKVRSGTPYIGWSAGSNITGLTICTTNDMPIIQPQSFTAFGFLPFQINPHYVNLVVEGFHGETRDQRLTEFMFLHPGIPVVGLPEGTALLLKERNLQLLGKRAAVLFQYQQSDAAPVKKEIAPGTDLSFLFP